LNLAASVYQRDRIGDTCDQTLGRKCLSPDIIALQSPVSKPQAIFGHGGGKENSDNLSQPLLAGHPASVYVRVLNCGGSDAKDVAVSVYSSPPATMATPNFWQPIGTTNISSVVMGRVLTVSDAIPWTPPLDHYSMIAVCGTTDKPAPSPADLGEWDKWVDAVQNSSSVSWRSFNVISSAPSADAHHLPLIIPGAPNSAREFTIKTLGSLPRGSTVQLEMPQQLVQSLRIVLPEPPVNGSVGVVPLHPFARSLVGTGVLTAGSAAECTLVVRVPDDTYEKDGVFEFAVSQMFGSIEMGRVTWHFGKVPAFKN